jgi:hypothetical protein
MIICRVGKTTPGDTENRILPGEARRWLNSVRISRGGVADGGKMMILLKYLVIPVKAGIPPRVGKAGPRPSPG